MTIEFGDPSVREHFWSARRLPAEPRRHRGSALVHGKALDIFREEFEEASGEEMTVAVAEWHRGILAREGPAEWTEGTEKFSPRRNGAEHSGRRTERTSSYRLTRWSHRAPRGGTSQ